MSEPTRTYEVIASWEGSAAIEVDAASAVEAEAIAYQTWCGFTVEGGRIDYVIEGVDEVDGDE